MEETITTGQPDAECSDTATANTPLEQPVVDETTAQQPAQASSPGPADATADIQAAIAEAEQRGYLRALNELASQKFDAPVPGQRANPETSPSPLPPTSTPMILANMRKSIWDK